MKTNGQKHDTSELYHFCNAARVRVVNICGTVYIKYVIGESPVLADAHDICFMPKVHSAFLLTTEAIYLVLRGSLAAPNPSSHPRIRSSI